MPHSNSSSVQNGPEIRHNVNLKPMNTLGVEAHADTFVEIQKAEQLPLLYEEGFFAEESPIILGGGSNLLFGGQPGRPVLKMSVKKREVIENDTGTVHLKAGAGENWHELVSFAVEKDLGGIENLALIPGTVGAAPIQNIGAYGVELKDVFVSLSAFDTVTGEFEIYTADECSFGYRDSVFKHDLKGRMIVCEVTLKLNTWENHTLNLSYSGLSDSLKSKNIDKPTIRDVYNTVVAIRRSKLPDPSDIGNAGSFFKNPIVSEEKFETLKADYPGLPGYKLETDEVKIPAAWLIEKTGWKGRQVGNVGTYENQALVIVNHGGATGEEIFNHAKTIQKSVLETFGIDLMPEVNIIGIQS